MMYPNRCSPCFMPFCFNAPCHCTILHNSCPPIFSLIALWLAALYYANPYQFHYFLYEYHFQFMPFWFTSTFSGIKLWHKIRVCVGLYELHHTFKVYTSYLHTVIVSCILFTKHEYIYIKTYSRWT
jgi:hypothetical protein